MQRPVPRSHNPIPTEVPVFFRTPYLNRLWDPLGRLWRRREDNIRVDLRETGWKVVDLMHLAQDREQGRGLGNTVMDLRVP